MELKLIKVGLQNGHLQPKKLTM